MDTVSALSSLSSSLNSQPPSSHFSPVFGGQRGRGSEQGRALQEGSHAGVACSVPLCSLPRQVFKTSPRDVCSNVGKLGRKAPTLPLSAAPQSSPVSLPGPLLPPDPKGAGLGSGNPASRGSRAPPPPPSESAAPTVGTRLLPHAPGCWDSGRHRTRGWFSRRRSTLARAVGGSIQRYCSRAAPGPPPPRVFCKPHCTSHWLWAELCAPRGDVLEPSPQHLRREGVRTQRL